MHAASLSPAGRPLSARSRRHRRCRSRDPTQPRPTTAWTPSPAGCSALTAARYLLWGRGTRRGHRWLHLQRGRGRRQARSRRNAADEYLLASTEIQAISGSTRDPSDGVYWRREGPGDMPPTKCATLTDFPPRRVSSYPKEWGTARAPFACAATRLWVLGSSSQRGRGEQAIDARLHERHALAVDLGSEEPQRCRVHEQTERDRQHDAARDVKAEGGRARAWRPDRPIAISSAAVATPHSRPATVPNLIRNSSRNDEER